MKYLGVSGLFSDLTNEADEPEYELNFRNAEISNDDLFNVIVESLKENDNLKQQ